MNLRWLPLLLLAGCVSLVAPGEFLKTGDAPWNRWLDERIEVSLVRVSLEDALRRPIFAGLKFALDDVDPNTVVNLEIESTTRGRALYTLAERYGLSMSVAAGTVRITNRVVKKDNRPLP